MYGSNFGSKFGKCMGQLSFFQWNIPTKIILSTCQRQKKRPNKPKDDNKSKGLVVVPYIEGLSEKASRVFRKHGIAIAMKSHTTLRNMLVHPRISETQRKLRKLFTRSPVKLSQQKKGKRQRRTVQIVADNILWKPTTSQGGMRPRLLIKRATGKPGKWRKPSGSEERDNPSITRTRGPTT